MDVLHFFLCFGCGTNLNSHTCTQQYDSYILRCWDECNIEAIPLVYHILLPSMASQIDCQASGYLVSGSFDLPLPFLSSVLEQ